MQYRHKLSQPHLNPGFFRNHSGNLQLERKKDLTTNLHHVMDFSSVPVFEAVMLNTGTIVHGYGEYLEEALKIKDPAASSHLARCPRE